MERRWYRYLNVQSLWLRSAAHTIAFGVGCSVLVGVVGFGCAVDGAEEAALFAFEQDTTCGNIKGPPRLLIRNGTLSPTIALSPGQAMAVGQVHRSAQPCTSAGTSLGTCTATVINDSWALSAGHCFSQERGGLAWGEEKSVAAAPYFLSLSPEEDGNMCAPSVVTVPILAVFDSVQLEAQARALGLSIPVRGASFGSDVALLRLGASVRARLPALEPLELTRRRLTNADVGQSVAIAGYGSEVPFGPGSVERRWTRLVIDQVSAALVVTDGQARSGPCQGDSGGPLLMLEPAAGGFSADVLREEKKLASAPPRVRLIGTLWGGVSVDDRCVDQDRWSRVDVLHDAITTLAGPSGRAGYSGPESKCGPTGEGACISATEIQRCTAGVPDTAGPENCALSGRVCGLKAKNTWECVAPEEDLCEGYRPWGACIGETSQIAIWCEPDFDASSGPLRQRDCARCGPEPGAGTCGFSSFHNSHYCLH